MNAIVPFSAFDRRTKSAGEIMPRSTIEAIVRKRDTAIALYENAHSSLLTTNDALTKAHAALLAIRSRESSFNYHSRGEEQSFIAPLKLPDMKTYVATARRLTDVETWSHIIEMTDLERLMDKEAKETLRKQLMDDPPEVTVENVYATLQQFVADADMIFRRGIANAFSKLDRRFRSHDGFKIGARVILERMFDEHGWWNHHRDMESMLIDIERAFLVIEGTGNLGPLYGGIVGLLRDCRRPGAGARQDMVENDYFRIRVFKNGNCHLWFKRDDLVEQVNKLLAEYYGEVIPDGMTPADDGGLHDPKTSLAKNYGFFPTPEEAAERAIETARLYRDDDAPRLRLLEPSAGTGNLARRAVARGCEVHCIEAHPERTNALRAEGIYASVLSTDFLAVTPHGEDLFDVALMNPPFDRERDIDHVMHALHFLKPNGHLVAIMSAGTEFRGTRKSIAFREQMEKMGARIHDLPAGSFSSVGTNVNTIIVSVYKDGEHRGRRWDGGRAFSAEG
jgi:predicted RNA methylase